MPENRYVSKTGKIEHPAEKIYHFLSDFRNFENLLPPDKVSNFEASADKCSFDMAMLGKAGLYMVEKEPFKLIKISGDQDTSKEFYLWIQLKQLSENDTRVRITMEVKLNPMMRAMASKPLEKFVNTMVDQVVKIDYA